MERFYIRIFLLDYLPATANKHYQSGFKVFHLIGVELLLSGLYQQTSSTTIYRFLSSASTALQVLEAHKCFHHGKVVVNRNNHKVSKRLIGNRKV